LYLSIVFAVCVDLLTLAVFIVRCVCSFVEAIS
jgi:hypothetical protein